MSNYQCKWCRRSYDPIADGFCSERCRHEARSSGWKSEEEKFWERAGAHMRASAPRSIKQIRYDKIQAKVSAPFQKFVGLLGLFFTFIFITDGRSFLHQRWPPSNSTEWILFLGAMCIMYVPYTLLAMLLLVPVVLVWEISLCVFFKFFVK